mmetsp:Transcript_6897/g.19358  ORF Transcript_6897/g.19358 Transcript_6897/m.19358 type:complete len:193 (-) Transcript_6897:31-609(-)
MTGGLMTGAVRRRHAKKSSTSRFVKPAKPSSGYNYFYQDETSRVRRREGARYQHYAKVILRRREMSSSHDGEAHQQISSSSTSSSSPEKNKSPNRTALVGGRWKALPTDTAEIFAMKARAGLELYHANKALWAVLEQVLAKHAAAEAAEGGDGVQQVDMAQQQHQMQQAAVSADALRDKQIEAFAHLVSFLY